MRLWVMREDPRTSQIANDHRSTGRVLNGMEIFEASMAFNTARVGDAPRSDPYPPDFRAPRVRFAEGRLSDLTVIENLRFVSDRLRRSMDLPEDAAQFVPVRNVSRPPRARAARFSLLHVLASGRVVDGDRSDCHVDHPVSARSGERIMRLKGLTAIRFLPDATPPADLFVEAAAPTVLLATDALAGRVLEAGCSGVQFRHPLWFAAGFEHVVRTRDGVARVVWNRSGRDYALEPFALDEADAGPQDA